MCGIKVSVLGCQCWGVSPGVSVLECQSLGVSPGVSVLVCQCSGVSVFGQPGLDVI